MSAEATTRTAGARRRLLVALRHGVGATLAGALIISGLAAPAMAEFDQTISWDDVVAAQGQVDKQQRLVGDIQSEIAELDGELATARASADAAGTTYSLALAASNEKAGEVQVLQTQADTAQRTADSSREQAGQLAAAMASRGAGDPSLSLFMQPENADDLLYQLGTISKLSGQTNGIYNQAVAEQNTASALGEQATAALEELRALEATAKSQFDGAQAAQIALQTQKNAADQRRAELQAMLAPLIDQRNVTAADYNAAEQLRIDQLARENTQRAAAAAAAQQQAYQEALAEAEAAGVAPPPAPQIPAAAPPLVVPEDVPTNPDGTLATGGPGTSPNQAPSTTAPATTAPATTAPAQPAPADPSPTTSAVPAPADPAPTQPAPVPVDPVPAPVPVPIDPDPIPVDPAPVPVDPDPVPVDPAPVPVDPIPVPADPDPGEKPDIVPYEPPERPDIVVVPEPDPEPPAPTPNPTPDGVVPGYHGVVTSGYVTSEYGMRLHPISGVYRMHNGLDLGIHGGTCGAPLFAVHSGTVTYSGYNGGFGNHVVLDIGGGVVVSYSHIIEGGLNVYVGQQVNPGDVIAYAGTTGSSTGCHLHFELKHNGTLMDPKPWLASLGIYYY